MVDVYIHSTAIVDKSAKIGKGSQVWVNVQIREKVLIGDNCILSKDVYIDHGVKIGNGVKIQNGVSVYHGVAIEDDVFLGPNCTFTNDRVPRAFNKDWQPFFTLIKRGASIGANATIICGITIGEYALVGAGSVVTKDVAPYSMVVGNPARHRCYVDKNGNNIGVKAE